MKLPLTIAILATQAAAVLASTCYCLPGDSCWPSDSTWASLNDTVGGRLIATVPLGSPCHDPNYNATACAALQSAWTEPETHLDSSSSVMEAYFANRSCDPFTAENTPCSLGNYVSYAVNVSSSADVIASINFATTNNIRLLVRNTGHDFLGRSTGAGALAIWTHHLRSIDFLDWSDSYYNGKAIKVGAGVLGYEALEAAAAQNLVVVTGTCPTVGIAGGYTQGGGHSVLSTNFGLGADQTLEFEVVIANGTVLNASRTENSDLYWALSGGGGGTYGVVLSMTIRAHPDAPVAGALFEMAAAYTTADNYYAAVTAFHSILPNMTDQGATLAYIVNNEYLLVDPITAYNQTSDDLKTMFSPFLEVLANLSIPYTISYTDSATYLDHYENYMGPLPNGRLPVESYNFGGRLIPREVIEDNSAGLGKVLRNLTENGVLIVGVALNATAPDSVSNAVLPWWRKATITMQLTTPWNSTAPWSDMIAAQTQMTNEFVPQIEAITPYSGTYMNEADFQQPNWQWTFFGTNYAELVYLKTKWDPNLIFYANRGVGSEYWNISSSGRMCRT